MVKPVVLAVALVIVASAIPAQSVPRLTGGADLQRSLAGAAAFVYKRAAGATLTLWVFSPKGLKASESRPAIVFFGGGGWTTQDPAQFSPQARYLATKGLVTIVADYRVRNLHNATPYESVADAKSAIRWLREHAGELRIVPTSLAAGGGSAGGHVALTAAFPDTFDEPGANQRVSAKPNALVLFNPVTNTVPGPRAALTSQQQGLRALMGSRAQEISPIHHLAKNLPPTIIFHGRADTLVPFSKSEVFCRKANALGNRCELVAFDGAGHGFFNPEKSIKWYYETLFRAEQFLADHGYIR